jgi:hypothetical protein
MVSLGLVFLFVGAASPTFRPIPVSEQGKGTDGVIELTVRYRGPKRPASPLGTHDSACPKDREDGNLLAVGDALANVVVYVKGKLEKLPVDPHPLPVTVVDEGCRMRPRVQVVQPVSELLVVNLDHTVHNFHAAQTSGESLFNYALPQNAAGVAGRSFSTSLTSGPYRIACDIHGEHAVVFVSEGAAAAVTGTAGMAKLYLPPGEYTLEAWHETLGNQSMATTVKPGFTTVVEMDFR